MNNLLLIKTFICFVAFLSSCGNVQTTQINILNPVISTGILPSTNKIKADSIAEDENNPYYPNLNDDIILCTNGALPYYISCPDTGRAEKLFYNNSKIMTEGKFKNGKRTGLWFSYYNNPDDTLTKVLGSISATGIFVNGFPLGRWTFYYENGNKKAEGEFVNGKFELGCAGSNNFIPISILNGKWDFWFEDGKQNVSCTFKSDKFQQERLSGIYTEWFSNGNKKREGSFKNGSKTGKWTYCFKNGNKKREEFYQYKDCGLEDYVSYECPCGIWTWWNESGSVMKKEEYINGIKKE
ncbi:MAG: hypothetical protein IAF38_11460 [Bacteroidia bacterium]|nr:hypothetical protein [Bacteroidia bacterium]